MTFSRMNSGFLFVKLERILASTVIFDNYIQALESVPFLT